MNITRFQISVAIMVLIFSVLACDIPAIPTPYNIYVTTTGNDSNDCRSTAHACRTLTAAITKAVPRSQIIIGAGTFPAHETVGKWLNFVGASQTSTILSRSDPSGPAFSISDAVHASFTNLTVSGGNYAIELNGNNIATQVSATNVTISNSGVGIINHHGSAILLNNDSVLNNGFGVSTNGGTFTASNTVFRGNTRVAIDNSSVSVLDHVTVDQNGSAIENVDTLSAIMNSANSSSTGHLKIVFATITNNHEGGITNQAGIVGMDSSLVAHNAGYGITNAASFDLAASVVTANGLDGIASGNPGETTANMSISRTAIYANGAEGVQSWSGATTISNTTISGNHDAGITNSASNLTLTNDSVAFNTGMGLSVAGLSPTQVVNSIIALNATPNCLTTRVTLDASSLACNDALTNTTLKLGSLTAAAGTFVLPLRTGSPAIDAASPDSACPMVDQRGYARPAGPHCDVGAYEFGAALALTAGTSSPETPTLPVLEIVTDTPTGTQPVLQIVTDTPTATATDTPTAQSSPQVTFIENANCRKGPGAAYDVATSFVKGKTLDAVGRNADSSWWLVQIQPGSTCWVGDSTVSKSGSVEQLAIVNAPPLPEAPSKFVNSDVCDTKLKKQTVDLNWETVAGATGYNLYRDGSLLMTFGAGTTTYVDHPSLSAAHTYAVETLNGFGHSGQVTTSVPACK